MLQPKALGILNLVVPWTRHIAIVYKNMAMCNHGSEFKRSCWLSMWSMELCMYRSHNVFGVYVFDTNEVIITL